MIIIKSFIFCLSDLKIKLPVKLRTSHQCCFDRKLFKFVLVLLQLVNYAGHCATYVSPLELPIRAWFSGDVHVGIRLRPVNSMRLARQKGSPRCAVKILFREFIKSVTNFLQKNFFKETISIKNNHFATLFCLFGCS